MMLKQVVLPAPFGPISPRISPRRTSKLTSSRAVRPPKRTVSPSTASRVSPFAHGELAFGRDRGRHRRVVLRALGGVHVLEGLEEPLLARGRVERRIGGRRLAHSPPPRGEVPAWSSGTVSGEVAPRLARRRHPARRHGRPRPEQFLVRLSAVGQQVLAHPEQTLRAEDHQDDEGDAEDQEPVGRLELEPVGDVRDEERPEDHADLVALPAEHHRGEVQRRRRDVEALVVDVADLGGEQRARQTADRRADREGPDLEPVGRDAGELRGVLVLAHGDPRAPHPRALEVPHEQQDDHDDHDREPVEAQGVGLREDRGAVREVAPGTRDVLEAPVAAQRVDVVGEQPDDLAEARA